jgi:anti-sigma factor RsiW
MTSKFPAPDQDRSSNLNNQEGTNAKENCFELLSAYLDGEVTPQERHQVQYWLDRDPEIKKIYLQLHRIHHSIQGLNIPVTKASTPQLSEAVFQKLDRRQQKKRIFVWGGGTVAALCLVALSNIFSSTSSPNFKLANSPEKEQLVNQSLMVAIAIDKPTVKIPKITKAGTAFSHQQGIPH